MIVQYLLFVTYALLLFSGNLFLIKTQTVKKPTFWKQYAFNKKLKKKTPKNPLLLFGITLLSTLSILFFTMAIAPKEMSSILFGVATKPKVIVINKTDDTKKTTTVPSIDPVTVTTSKSVNTNEGTADMLPDTKKDNTELKTINDEKGCILLQDTDCKEQKNIMGNIGIGALVISIISVIGVIIYKYKKTNITV